MLRYHYQSFIPLRLLFLFLAVIPSTTHAQTTAGATTTLEARVVERQEAREERREELQDMREERQAERASNTAARAEAREERLEERQEQVAERRAQLTERTQERITNLAANISNRIDAAIERLRNIAGRFESRRDTINDRGIATPEADLALADAIASLESAEATMADIDEAVAAVTGSESPREAWQGVRAQYQEAVTAVRTTRQHLRDAVASLKASVSSSIPATPETDANAGTSSLITE